MVLRIFRPRACVSQLLVFGGLHGLPATAVGQPAAEPETDPSGGAGESKAGSEPARAPVSATDSPTEIAKQNYRIGVAAFREGRFRDSITAFLVADKLAPSAALSFNIARAFDELDEPAESLYWYIDYLRRSPGASDKQSVAEHIAEREARLKSKGVQLLVVLSDPSPASVSVDGEDVGTTPWHGVLPPGEHTLSLGLAGHETQTVPVELSAEKSLVLPVTLEVEQAAPPPAAVQEKPPPPAPPAQPAEPVRAEEGTNIWPWVALGAGAVGFGAAGAFELARRSAESDVEEGTVQVEVEDALDRMDRHQTTAQVMLGVGVVFTAVGGTLLFLDSGSSESASGAPEGASALIPAVGPDGFNIRLRRRF